LFFATYTSAQGRRVLFETRSSRGRRYREFDFTLGEVRSIIGRILNRKMRNNGIGQALLFDLDATGICELSFGNGQSGSEFGFVCRRTERGFCFSFFGFGRAAQILINRLNDPTRHALTLVATRRLRKLRREEIYITPRTWVQKVGAKKDLQLVRQFKHSTLLWQDAVKVIAQASKESVWWVQTHLYRSLTPEGVATLCMHVKERGTFSFKVTVPGYRGLVGLDTRVEMESTKDNEQGVYRRLRNSMRRALNRERKQKQVVREQVRAFREAKRRMHILAAT